MVLCLFVLTACGPTNRQLMGDPQNPYPLQSAPQIGQIVHLPTGAIVSATQMFALAGDARIVYFGETHDNPASHRLELQLLQALAELHPGRQALGMEMFAHAQQPLLDRWVAGELNEKAFLKESRWFENWGMDFAYYRDLLNFARERRIPVIALNAERSLVGALRGKPPDQLSAEEQARLPKLDLNDPYQRGLVAAIFGDHSHQGMQLDGFRPCSDVVGRDHGRVGGPLPGEPLRQGDAPAGDRRRQSRELWLWNSSPRLPPPARLLSPDRRQGNRHSGRQAKPADERQAPRVSDGSL